MQFTLVMILIFGISCSNADETYKEESGNKAEENVTDVYYKGVKVTKPEDFCEQNVCVTKCCPFGDAYNIKSKSCVNSTKIFNPQMYDKYLRPQSNNASDLFHFKIDVVQCVGQVRFLISVYAKQINKEYKFRTDGKLYVESPHTVPPWLLVNPENYCIDNFVEEADGKNITIVDALVCFVEDEDLHDYILTATCMLISCVFILLTVGVYVWLPKLHNVHGRVLIAYLVCLFVGFLLLATMQLLLHYSKTTRMICESMTYVIYFSLLSAFFWLNVMCYDIWRVFSGKREIRPQTLVVWRQIRSYAIYAFGIPTTLTILLISLEYSGLPQNPWLPLVRFQGCFLSGNGRLLYLYGPMLVLCVANMVLFILTAVKIAMTQKETSVLSSRESSRSDQQNDKQTLFLYVKLFVVMGISWILEVMSALYPSKNWRVMDAYNVLIGLIIFIIFVCKRQIFHLLKERVKQKFQQCRSGDLGSSIRMDSVKHSQETIRSTVTTDSDTSKKANTPNAI